MPDPRPRRPVLRLPGLVIDWHRDAWRFRVRPKGDHGRRITIPAPDQPEFWDAYRAARAGERWRAEDQDAAEDRRASVGKPQPGTAARRAVTEAATGAHERSLAWLIDAYLRASDRDVAAGLLAPATVAHRRTSLARLLPEYGHFDFDLPRAWVIKVRDSLRATPGAADNTVKRLRGLFGWAMDQGYLTANPAQGIGKLTRVEIGATPWSLDDLNTYRAAHPPGTMAHLAGALLLFTACRVSDLYRLGPPMEVERHGLRHLAWQPAKAGSAPVEIPILPPLADAIAAADAHLAARPLHRGTYLLTSHGRPFASPKAMSNKFSDWCEVAGLVVRDPATGRVVQSRSSHGIRKAAGELLALAGCSQYQIMAVHGHAQAATSQVYTEGVNRARLAAQALETLKDFSW